MDVFTARLPPTITEGPTVHHIFRDDATINMICVATASVTIKYVFTFAMPPLTNISKLEVTANKCRQIFMGL